MTDLQIANTCFHIDCRDMPLRFARDDAYVPFFKCVRPTAVDVSVTLTTTPPPDVSSLPRLFAGGDAWSMYRTKNGRCMQFVPPGMAEPYWTALFTQTASDVIVHCGAENLSFEGEQQVLVNPVRYPLDQILLTYALATNRGVLVHAAAVEICGKGYIFAGKSGAGKSTLARQFRARKHPGVLTDDRVVVCDNGDGGFRAFGTPWTGEAGVAVNDELPLAGIFFIRQAMDNRIEEVTEAAAMMMPVVSLLWYDGEVLPGMLDCCDRLIRQVPTFNLYVRPDEEIVDVLESFAST